MNQVTAPPSRLPVPDPADHALATPPVDQINHRPQPHLQRIWPIVVVADWEIFQLLHKQLGANAASLESQKSVGQIIPQSANPNLFIDQVFDLAQWERKTVQPRGSN